MGVFRECSHVLSYKHFIGPIPEGKLVCHECDFRPCCNPEHLFLGTYGDNQKDMAAKDRVAFGERHHNAKITENDVLEIYRLGRCRTSPKDIADRFGVTASSIRKVLNGDHWRRLYKQHML
jgi:hypothetical protein